MEICEKRRAYLNSLRNYDDKISEAEKLQNQYRAGKIKEEDLTEKQKQAIYKLYDNQIANLKKSSDVRKNNLFKGIKKIIKDDKLKKSNIIQKEYEKNFDYKTNLKSEKEYQNKEEIFKNKINVNLKANQYMLEYKLENKKINISDLTNEELDKMIEHYKRKNKVKENILKIKRRKLNNKK